MASSREQTNGDDYDDVPLQYIVFSCGVCQATIPEVYVEKESNQGFHSGSGDDNGIVTKLWIAECSHIVCGKHLDGGAAPFHPKGEQPRAPCPQCQEKGDDAPRELYGIRGLHDGEFDAAIPHSWMDCPAIKLDGSVPGMEALRFQYLNMARYAQRVTRYWKLAERNQHAMESAYSNERKQRRQAQREILDLKAKVEELEGAEAKLQKWESRKPVINHYLGVVNEMAKDIESMRHQLSQLGYAAPERSYSFGPDQMAAEQDAAKVTRSEKQQHPGKSFSSSSTAVALDHDNSSSSRKRKLSEYAPETARDAIVQRPQHGRRSRDLMPPPLPRHRLCQQNAPSRVESATTQRIRRPPSSRQSIQVYEDQSWRAPQQRPHESASAYTSSTRHHALPYRPSPSQGRPPTDARRDAWESYHDDVLNQPLSPLRTDELPRPHQPLEQTQMDPSGSRQGPIRRPDEERYEAHSAQQRLTNRPAPRILQYDADYGTVSQQREDQARLPLQLYPASRLDQQSVREVRSPQRQSQPPAASVISPFFKRGAAPPVLQHLPTRGSFVHPLRSQAHETPPSGYRMAPSQRDSSYGYSQRPNIEEQSFADKLHRASGHQPPYQSPTYRPELNNTYSREYAVPQTPRNSQGLFQRPDRPLPSATYAPSRPQSTFQRSGRITLPPNQHHPSALAGSQEQALSQIRGVRGVSSQSVRPNQYQNGPLYDTPRTLFSAAGGRRSVRR